MKSVTIALFLSLGFLSASFGQDKPKAPKKVRTGKQVWKKVKCMTCHKKDGSGMAKIKDGKPEIKTIMTGPQIAGLKASYMEEQIKAIRDKKRVSEQTKKMHKDLNRAGITDEEIKNVAKYVAEKINKKKLSIKGMYEK